MGYRDELYNELGKLSKEIIDPKNKYRLGTLQCQFDTVLSSYNTVCDREAADIRSYKKEVSMEGKDFVEQSNELFKSLLNKIVAKPLPKKPKWYQFRKRKAYKKFMDGIYLKTYEVVAEKIGKITFLEYQGQEVTNEKV